MKREMLFGLVALLPTAALAAGWQVMDDGEMAGVAGQHGIAIDVEYRLNADENGDALTTGFGSCQNTHLCNIAIHSNNRDSAGGEWLVLKDAYGSYRINTLHIDAAFSPASGTDYADSTRFRNAAGTLCLLNGAAYTAACADAVRDKPVMQFSYPNGAGFTPDFEIHLHIGRASLQYGETGPSTDNGKSFMGLLVSDSRPGQKQAQIDFGGRAFMSGF